MYISNFRTLYLQNLYSSSMKINNLLSTNSNIMTFDLKGYIVPQILDNWINIIPSLKIS